MKVTRTVDVAITFTRDELEDMALAKLGRRFKDRQFVCSWSDNASTGADVQLTLDLCNDKI